VALNSFTIVSWTFVTNARDSSKCTAREVPSRADSSSGNSLRPVAYALDPFDPGRDIAEQTFNSELANWFDNMP
jgi:hypothetical protein